MSAGSKPSDVIATLMRVARIARKVNPAENQYE